MPPSEAVSELVVRGRPVPTVFDLLGRQENDMTFALGWGLAASEELLRSFLGRVELEAPAADVVIRLQEFSPAGGFTDIELIAPGRVHVIVEAKRPWTTKFRKGYVAIQRPSGYNVAIVDLYGIAVPRFAVKLPAEPGSLGLTDPYLGAYRVTWTGENEWGWTIPNTGVLPDVRAALDLAVEFHPLSGPMVMAPHQ